MLAMAIGAAEVWIVVLQYGGWCCCCRGVVLLLALGIHTIRLVNIWKSIRPPRSVN